MNSVSDPTAALEGVTTLFQRLNDEGIRYCQWKSTYGLPKALLGKTDFDLLIDRAHIQRFKQILCECDFKPFVSHPSRQYPGIEDFLGFDATTGRLIHLHIHYRVVLGEEYVKNYSIPLDEGLLDNTQLRLGIKIPAPEVELIVLALRALLKYRDRDVARDALGLGRSGGIPAATLDECRRLLARTSADQVARALERYAGFLSPGLVLTFLATIQNAPRSGRVLYRLRGQARRELAPYQRHSRLRAGAANFWIMLTKQSPFDRIIRRLLPNRDKHKTPASGGMTVAFVGADGAGKSTIIKHIVKWLSWRLVVRTYYMGSSRPSAGTRALKGAADLAQLGYAGCRRLFGERSAITRLADRLRRLFDNLRYLGDGRDRYRRYLAGQQSAARGAVVIYDRYPIRAVRIFNRPLDGPRVASTSNGQIGPLSERLAQSEERIYQKILPPDHVFVLHVSPDVSQARKPEHRREVIEAKSRAIRQIAPDGFGQTDIDADMGLDQVLLQIKATLWNLL
jgi:hypothetical protein